MYRRLLGQVQDLEWFLNHPDQLHAGREALRITFVYALVGGLWILLTDELLFLLIEDWAAYHELQRFKGWFYVAATALLLYGLIRSRMQLLTAAVKTATAAYRELEAGYEELNASQEALRDERNLNQSIIDNVPAILMVWNSSGQLEHLNPYARHAMELNKTNWPVWLRHVTDGDLDRFLEWVSREDQRHDQEIQWTTPSGRTKHIMLNSSLLDRSSDAKTYIVSGGTDLTEKRQLEQKLHRLAYYDTLTGLPNQAYLENRLQQRIAADSRFALVWIDIDSFQDINNTLGHETGDEFLRHAAKQLGLYTSENDILVRTGGNEFAMALDGIEDEPALRQRLEPFLNAFGVWEVGGREFAMTFSAGTAFCPSHGDSVGELQRCANTALNDAKHQGRSRLRIYDASIAERNTQMIELSAAIRRALDEKQFQLHYQPHVALDSETIVGAEALLRWPCCGSYTDPMQYIPLAENTGQIFAIDTWVFSQALTKLRNWQQPENGCRFLSINISSQTINNTQALGKLLDLAKQHPDACRLLVLEITETALLGRMDQAVSRLQNLRDLGIRIALDDFGTGYSSLNYITQLPLQLLKLDSTFIGRIGHSRTDEAVIRLVLEMAAAVGHQVIAEGIETQEQWNFLRRHGCHMGQGYFFHRPMPWQDLEQVMADDAVRRSQQGSG